MVKNKIKIKYFIPHRWAFESSLAKSLQWCYNGCRL